MRVPEEEIAYGFKIVIVGPESTGKSALVRTYCKGTFNDAYKPTIGISIIEKELQISKNYNLRLFLLDLGGIKSFAKIRKFYIFSINMIFRTYPIINNLFIIGFKKILKIYFITIQDYQTPRSGISNKF